MSSGSLAGSPVDHTWWARKDPCPFSCYKLSLFPITVIDLIARIKSVTLISPSPLMSDVKSIQDVRICQWPDQVSKVSAEWAAVMILGKWREFPSEPVAGTGGGSVPKGLVGPSPCRLTVVCCHLGKEGFFLSQQGHLPT